MNREVWELVKKRREQAKNSRSNGIHRNENSHFLYGVVFCGDCGSPYKRRTIRSRDGQFHNAWECRDRLLGAKGNGCKNSIFPEESLLRQISDMLGITWNGVDAFDIDAFQRMAVNVEVAEGGVRVIQEREKYD